ncbi:hypothetical protein C8Q76DRAFT_133586 [Earliella scabrosa]|nr:hypothetical protein C8Q76DRAFT_133586 [Earliella scabrosa]
MRVWCVAWIAILDWNVVWYARLMISSAGIRTSTNPWTLLLPSLPLVGISSVLAPYGHAYTCKPNLEVSLYLRVHGERRRSEVRV